MNKRPPAKKPQAKIQTVKKQIPVKKIAPDRIEELVKKHLASGSRSVSGVSGSRISLRNLSNVPRDSDAPRRPPTRGPSPAAIPLVWPDHRSREFLRQIQVISADDALLDVLMSRLQASFQGVDFYGNYTTIVGRSAFTFGRIRIIRFTFR